jgi:hypothetical protein
MIKADLQVSATKMVIDDFVIVSGQKMKGGKKVRFKETS